MCDYCEEEMPITPYCADVPGMDVELYIERSYDIGAKKHYVSLVAKNFITNEDAYFSIDFCPKCGRKLAERGQ